MSFSSTPEQMSEILLDDDIDLSSLNDVIRALTAAGFKTSQINLYMDEAIELTREYAKDTMPWPV